MKVFKCDKCGKEFNQPLDEEIIKNEHGVITTYDLCAPCRKKLKEDKEKVHKNFFKNK